MKILQIQKIGKYNSYTCLLEDNSQITLVLEFYNTVAPQVGDKILINSELLDKSNKHYTQPYSFTSTKELTAKQIKELEHINFAVLKHNKKYIALKRIYG